MVSCHGSPSDPSCQVTTSGGWGWRYDPQSLGGGGAEEVQPEGLWPAWNPCLTQGFMGLTLICNSLFVNFFLGFIWLMRIVSLERNAPLQDDPTRPSRRNILMPQIPSRPNFSWPPFLTRWDRIFWVNFSESSCSS